MNPACAIPRCGRLLALGAGLLAPRLLQAGLSSTNWGPAVPLPPEVGLSVFRVFGALALVFLILFAGVWFFRNWQGLLARRGHSARLRILEARSVGNRQTLMVVAYERQRLLVGSSPAGIHLITPLPSAETDEPAAPAATLPFADALHQILGRK